MLLIIVNNHCTYFCILELLKMAGTKWIRTQQEIYYHGIQSLTFKWLSEEKFAYVSRSQLRKKGVKVANLIKS